MLAPKPRKPVAAGVGERTNYLTLGFVEWSK
jgi:hypothetical protein